MTDDGVPVLFIGGLGRSGSTLIDRILGQTPGVCSVGELVFLWERGLLADERCGCGEAVLGLPVLDRGRRAILRRVGSARSGGDARPPALRRSQPLHPADAHALGVAAVSRVGCGPTPRRCVASTPRAAAVSGAALVVDSSKHASTAALLARVPGVAPRIAHLVRDPRGVAWSWAKHVDRPDAVGALPDGARGHGAHRGFAGSCTTRCSPWCARAGRAALRGLRRATRARDPATAALSAASTVDELPQFIDGQTVELGGQPHGRRQPAAVPHGRDRRSEPTTRGAGRCRRTSGVAHGAHVPEQPDLSVPAMSDPRASHPCRRSSRPAAARPFVARSRACSVSATTATSRASSCSTASSRSTCRTWTSQAGRSLVSVTQHPDGRACGRPQHRSPTSPRASCWRSATTTTCGGPTSSPPRSTRCAGTGSTVSVTGVRIVDGRSADRPHPAAGRRRGTSCCAPARTEVHPSSVLVDRAAFLDVIGPIDESIPGSYGEDYEWLLRAAAAGPIAAVTEPLVTVHWGGSLFADRWATIIDAIAYLTAKHPGPAGGRRERGAAARPGGLRPRGAAASARGRRTGRGAASAGVSAEPRPYLALAVASGCVRASTIQRRANRAGRGV